MSEDCKKVFACLGASNHSEFDRVQNDYYATDPSMADALVSFGLPLSNLIWEPACGEKHLSNRLEELGYDVYSTDIVSRCDGMEELDFLSSDLEWNGDIVTNPPYSICGKFVSHALDRVNAGRYVCCFLRIQFLEGQARYAELLKDFPPKYVYIPVKRVLCAKNGNFADHKFSSAVCYAWFIWEKGWSGDPSIRWFNS